MTDVKDRERAEEAKVAMDGETAFRVAARRNRLLGEWAAGLMGKSEDEAAEYARAVIKADFEEAGHDDVVRKVAADLADLADEATIRAKMDELLALAKAQLMTEI